MVDLRDIMNILKKLLATLTNAYGQPHHPPRSGEDSPSPPPLASFH